MPTEPVETDLLQIAQRQPTADWLAAGIEEILEPDLPIIDAHHHFSEHWGGYLPGDLLADFGAHNVKATVYMQCGWKYRDQGAEQLKPVGETEAVIRACAAAGRRDGQAEVAAGIVGFADLRLGEAVDEVLAAQLAAGQGRFRGVRFSAARDPSFKHGVLPRPQAHLYADPRFREGYSRLQAHGMSFDAWVYHPQLEDVLALAVAFPHTTLVLDHFGGILGVGSYQGRREAALAQALPWLKRLAECPNVFVKIGGLGTAIFGFDFASRPLPPTSRQLADAWRPLFEPALAIFGADRCLLESNFPVDRSAARYAVIWNAFKRLACGASPEDKRRLFHDNAVRLYRLDLPAAR